MVRTHQPGQAVFRSILPEDIDWKPFPAFPWRSRTPPLRGFLFARAWFLASLPDGPLHAAIEEFAADGYTHVECFCPRCRVIRLRPMSCLPKISMGLTLAQFSQRLIPSYSF
jgi:hypothetical protein